jgi:uncharacterized protein (DUF1778 family)
MQGLRPPEPEQWRSTNPLEPQIGPRSPLTGLCLVKHLRPQSARLSQKTEGLDFPALTFFDMYGYSPYVIPANMEAAMPAPTAPREDRIELRATKEEKRLLATAAAYERLDVTSFIMRNVLPTARKVVDRAERIVLSERDSVRVLALLENPPKPTPALMAAARRRAARP